MISRAMLMGMVESKHASTSKKGADILAFVVVTRRLYRDCGTKERYQVSKHTVHALGKMVEHVKDIQEGDMVFVDGHIQNTPSNDDGLYFYSVKANEIRRVTKEDFYASQRD